MYLFRYSPGATKKKKKNGRKNSPKKHPHTASKEHEEKEEREDTLSFLFFCSYLDSEQQKVHVKVELGKNHLVGDSHKDTGGAVGHNTNGCRVG